MKIALVVPPINLVERYNKAIAHVAGSLPPLGLLSIATVLKQAGQDVIVLDGSVKSLDEILNKIGEFQPDMIGISAMTMMWGKAAILSETLRKTWPNVKIVVGGVHASLIKEKALAEFPSLDAVFWGEAEFSMLEYVRKCDMENSMDAIDGMAFRRQDGSIVRGGDREPIGDLDALPIPNREFVSSTEYIPAFMQYQDFPTTSMMTMRGCPFQCLFCLPDILGRKVRYRSIEKVIEEIEYLVNELGMKDIQFWDDVFTLDSKRVFDICEKIIKKKLHFVWSANARADCISKDLLTVMKQAGCWRIHYGIESLVQKNLDTLKKGITVEQMFQAVEWTKRSGIEVEASFIFGIPRETYQEGLETIRLAKKLDPDYAKFYPLSPYGKLFENIGQHGILVDHNEENFGGQRITFVPFSMTKRELQKLYFLAYRSFYFRPSMVYKRLRKIKRPGEFRKSLRGLCAVGQFFKQELKYRLSGKTNNDISEIKIKLSKNENI